MLPIPVPTTDKTKRLAMHTFLSWVPFWWVTDGIGMALWSRRVGSANMLNMAIAEICFGTASAVVVLVRLAPGLGAACVVPLVAFLWVLLLLRNRGLSRTETRRSRKEWIAIGRPQVWPERCTPPLLLVFVVSVLALLIFHRQLQRDTFELLSWLIAALVSSWTSPGCFGLASNRVTRWGMRCSVGLCLAVVCWLLAVRCTG